MSEDLLSEIDDKLALLEQEAFEAGLEAGRKEAKTTIQLRDGITVKESPSNTGIKLKEGERRYFLTASEIEAILRFDSDKELIEIINNG